MDGMRKMNSDGYEEAYLNTNPHEENVKEEKNQSDTKKMPYHLTLTDNETGEVMYDADVYALIGSIRFAEETAVARIAKCDTVGLAQTLDCAQMAVDKTMEELTPEKRQLVRVIRAAMAEEMTEVEEDTEGTEN